MNYAAAIFDIVDSRKIDNRYQSQYFIKDCLKMLNNEFSYHLKKHVIFGAGDEFQGLFFNIKDAFAYARKLQLLIYPIKIRCGIGYGPVKYDENSWQSTEIDGEAFYRARDALRAIPGKGSGVIFFDIHYKFNKYINMYSLASTDIKNRQSKMVRMIELLVDILNPLFLTKKEKDDFNVLLELLHNKKEIALENELKSPSRKIVGSYPYKDIDYKILLYYLEKFDVIKIYNSRIDDNKYYIDFFWNRGISVAIAEIVQTSRQNIDKHINLGKIKESRNMDGTILMMLEEVIKYG